MSVLSLDVGKTVGWARSNHTCGVLTLGHYLDDGHAQVCFEDWLADMIVTDRPGVLVVERPIFTGRIRGADFTVALARAAMAIAYRHEVPRRWMTAREWRKAALGSAKKPLDAAVIEFARAHGFALTSNHAADAAALLVADASRALQAL